jgi:uncharacterized protein (TIGR03790 family)
MPRARIQPILTTCFLFVSLLLSSAALSAQQAPAAKPESVVVVANKAVDGSVRVARAYLKRRAIPPENLIVINAPESEKISRESYIRDIHNPILSSLVENNLISGIEGTPDSFGRMTVSVLSNSVRYLVLCYGVPTHVNNVPVEQLDDARLREKQFSGSQANLLAAFREGPMAKNEASVDGELSLLLLRDVPMTGFVPNPYYNNRQPSGVLDILKVTRLDGPSPEAVIRMLDNALTGEEKGLKGRAYVDEDGRSGGYQMGNDWLAGTVRIFEALGYDLDHDTARGTIQGDHRMDAPVLYAGWYARNADGPFALPGFAFPPGAVAAHLHSFSAAPLRSVDRGWVGPLVERGVSATFGNTAEPYLRFTHQFNLFFAALAEGWNFADAAYMAIPALSWQNVSIGDPLFRPFAVGLEDQLEAIGNPLHILSDQYVVLRRIKLLMAAGQSGEALKLANRGMRETPGPALALLRARLLEADEQPEAARKGLAFLAELDPADSMEWGLYAEIADTLLRLGDARTALKIYRKLETQPMPEKVQLAFLKRGIQAAEKAGNSGLAIEWRTRVTPPPPPPKPEDSVPVDADQGGS